MANIPLVPKSEAIVDDNKMVTLRWQDFFNALQAAVNGGTFYGNPNYLLNGDFNFQRGIATPVTQADGNGTLFAEKWQIFGAATADYTITSTTYPNADRNTTGSTTYERVEISNFTTGDLYFYQRFTGANFLRQLQNKSISLSAQIFNNTSNKVKVRFGVYPFYDPSNGSQLSGATYLQEGDNVFNSTVSLGALGAVGAGNYIEFRLYVLELGGSTADFNLNFIKAEINDVATPLYQDNALEKARIDNS